MDRQQTFVANTQVTSAFLNELQDRMLSLMRPAGSVEITGMTRVTRSVINQFGNSAVSNLVPTAGYKAVDQTANGFDWRNAYVEGVITSLNSNTDRMYGAAEQYINLYLRNAVRFFGYLGSGSSSSFSRAGGDYYIEADWDGASNNFNLYADSTNGELRVYNITGADRRCFIVVHCVGKKP